MELVLIYLAIINTVTFLLYGFDKWRAKQGGRRISERTLLGYSLIGGSPGALLSMGFFRHKIRKPKFYLGVPLMLVIQATLAIYFYWC